MNSDELKLLISEGEGLTVEFKGRYSSKINEGLSEGLSEGLRVLLTVIKSTPGIKAKDLSPLLNQRPLKTIERQIKVLVSKHLIERRGSRKTGGYYAKRLV